MGSIKNILHQILLILLRIDDRNVLFHKQDCLLFTEVHLFDNKILVGIIVRTQLSSIEEDILLCLGMITFIFADGDRKRYRLEIPYISTETLVVGTGDLFAASLLAWMHKDGDLKVRGGR